MNFEVLFDPLFRLPFLVGLMVAIILPLLGVLLRLRDEWLAALGFAYLAGVSALLGLAMHIPAILSAPFGGMVGALVKGFARFRGNSIYAVMILVGWGGTMLIAANTTLGDVMGHAVVEGQLYFADQLHFNVVAIYLVFAFIALRWLMPRLIRARFFPSDEKANQLPAWRWHTGFDLLIALGMAIGVGTIGLMAAFALIFLPPWLAFRIAKNWRNCLLISLVLGIAAYICAFTIALLMDQPFGPMLVAVLVLCLSVIPVFSRS